MKKRKILHFHDFKHIVWLLKNATKQLVKGDFGEAKEAVYLVRIHLKYDSDKK